MDFEYSAATGIYIHLAGLLLRVDQLDFVHRTTILLLQFGFHRLLPSLTLASAVRTASMREMFVLRISSFLLSCAQPPTMSNDPLRPANTQIVDFIPCLLLFDGCS